MRLLFVPIDLVRFLGAQKNHLIEMVLLSTHNKMFLLRNKKNNFRSQPWSNCVILFLTMDSKTEWKLV